MSSTDKVTPSKQIELSSGFEESQAGFEGATSDSASSDAVRFAQTVALSRTFALIETSADREQVIALARRLAGKQDS